MFKKNQQGSHRLRENKLKKSEAIRNLPKMMLTCTWKSSRTALAASTTEENLANLGDAEKFELEFFRRKVKKLELQLENEVSRE